MAITTGTQAKVFAPAQRWRKILLRTLAVLALAVAISFLLRHIAAALDQGRGPAGFYRGMLQGALMPCALPNLLVGHDVVIYSQNNTGIAYKLGYTCGVNACGAIFFGIFFWRLNRWRKAVKREV